VIRAQTFLVILIVLMVIERGAVAVEPIQDNPVPLQLEPAVLPAETREVATATVATPPPSSSPQPPPTLIPSPTPSPPPTSTPTEPPVPTPTVVPTPTARPAPPETGLDYSLLVSRGSSDRLEVAFTFDAGEGRGYTEGMLDLLSEYGAAATFGVTGLWAQENPDLIDRILDDGHQLINHSWDHSSFTGQSTGTALLTPEERQWQVEATEDQIKTETEGYESSPYFRFPYGDYDLAALEQLSILGFSYTIWWSCDTLAWNGDPPDRIVQRCGTESDSGGPGAILLLHVAEDSDWAALQPLLIDYRDAGYQFVTIEQLLQP
jgi:peptidoglycan/xylan/chitin deacetylase (PgdA/CDA1 family)